MQQNMVSLINSFEHLHKKPLEIHFNFNFKQKPASLSLYVQHICLNQFDA